MGKSSTSLRRRGKKSHDVKPTGKNIKKDQHGVVIPTPGYEMEYCHAFKDDTPSSRKTRAVKDEAIGEVTKKCRRRPKKKRFRKYRSFARRLRKKRLKLAALPYVDPLWCEGTIIPKEVLKKNLTFFSGTKSREPSGIPPACANPSRVLSVLEDLVLLDNPEGLHMPGVFTLVPRDKVAEAYPKGFLARVHDGLNYMESMKPKSTQRAKGQRVVCQETRGDGSRYVTFGTSVLRGSPGLGHNLKGLDTNETHHHTVCKFIETVERLGAAYMDSESLIAIKAIRERCDYPTIDCGDGTVAEIWPSVSFGRNVFLSAHMDNDFFLSVTSVVAKDEEMNPDGKLKADSPICNCFCFPEQGVCVALRSGDVLIFNPLVYHCVSSRCDVGKDMFCLSMYLKTAVVGGNDNGEETKGIHRRKKKKAVAGGSDNGEETKGVHRRKKRKAIAGGNDNGEETKGVHSRRKVIPSRRKGTPSQRKVTVAQLLRTND